MMSAPIHDESSPSAQFEAVALPFMNALYNKAVHLSHNAEDAGDLVQETYLRAYRTFSNFESGTNAKAWLFTILYSVFINRYHKAKNEPDTLPIDEWEDTYHRELADPGWDNDMGELLESDLNWQGPEVRQALDQLPSEFRAAVLLVDVEELSYEEAAVVLQCPVGTVRSRLFRARRVLFVSLRNYARKMGFIRRNDS